VDTVVPIKAFYACSNILTAFRLFLSKACFIYFYRYLYWTSESRLESNTLLRIFRIKMDGSQSKPTEVVSLTEDGEASITGLTLDLSQLRAELYYAVTTFGDSDR